jgi:hypothetical protein
MSNDSDTKPFGPITALQALTAAELDVERLRDINKALVNTHHIWLLANSRQSRELDEMREAMSPDQEDLECAKRRHAEALVEQADAFARERSGYEAALLVAHQPARDAQVELHRVRRENATLREQVRVLTSAAHL